MPTIRYSAYKPKSQAKKAIEDANRILIDFEQQGYSLTLRQLYYQFVGHDLFPDSRRYKMTNGKWVRSEDKDATKNAQPNYDWLGKIISKARDAGMVDWNHIEDRHRNVRKLPHWQDADNFVKEVIPQYRHDLWKGQKTRVIVFVEKEALEQIIGQVSERWDVPYLANKGYLSSSAAWNVARNMMLLNEDACEKWIVLHLGDHDPSGIDMTRDIEERVNNYARRTPVDKENGLNALEIEVRRLALNREQIDIYNPPPNPAKQTDARFAEYQMKYGDESWELDALEPKVIDELIDSQIKTIVNKSKWNARLRLQTEIRNDLLMKTKKKTARKKRRSKRR